jgi:acyl carrier protein
MEKQQMSNQINNSQIDSEAIKNWLVGYMATLLETESEKIDPTMPFERYGLDSSAMIVLSGDLQSWLGCQLEPTLLYDYPTIEMLALYLEKSIEKKS